LSNTYADKAFLTNVSEEELVQRLKPNLLVKGRELKEGKTLKKSC